MFVPIMLLACNSITCSSRFDSSLASSSTSSSSWLPLPHVDRRQAIAGGTGLVCGASNIFDNGAKRADAKTTTTSEERSSMEASIESNPVIPVWPSWGGGRVVPVSLGGPQQDPFLLLAHHKHWFDPRDPLRKPFQMAGKALNIPYIDVEGFSMHPHRGFDIVTYILDGSDGFQHRDSLNKNAKIYRGGTAQYMQTGSGVLHEEFWETRPDKRTDIELFQIWINVPACQKMDEPVIQYIGKETEYPWIQETPSKDVKIRHIGATLDECLNRNKESNDDNGSSIIMDHVTMQPGTSWTLTRTSADQSAILYVRKGTGILGREQEIVKALQTATLHFNNGEAVTIQNTRTNAREVLDFLLLAGAPLGEPIAIGGPIVMNTQQEINDAYRQLQNGTFLKRQAVLREHAETLKRQKSGTNLV